MLLMSSASEILGFFASSAASFLMRATSDAVRHLHRSSGQKPTAQLVLHHSVPFMPMKLASLSSIRLSYATQSLAATMPTCLASIRSLASASRRNLACASLSPRAEASDDTARFSPRLQTPWATQSSERFLESSPSLSCFHCTYPATVMPFCWKYSFTASIWSADAIDGTNFAFEFLYRL